MKKIHSLKTLALAGLAAGAVWSGNAQACAMETYISTVCIMAWNNTANWGGGYVLADGRPMPVSQYQALYSLVGNTFGGTSVQFNLPDLRGRVVIGTGQNSAIPLSPIYNLGQTGGNNSVTLTTAQLPTHTHGVANLKPAWAVGTLAANTTLTGLAATTSLTNVSATVNGSSFKLNVAADGATNVPSSSTVLGTPGTTTKIYSTTAPSVALASSAISGTATVSLTGNATTTITGTPSTALSGAPALSLTGGLDAAGSSAPVDVRQPFIALRYFIAVNGIYPSID